jgi:hypothetical protein
MIKERERERERGRRGGERVEKKSFFERLFETRKGEEREGGW